VVGFYEDAGISGAKGRDKRPGFDRLIKDATGRKLDMIAAWSVDRLGRSLQDLVGFLTELQALHCDLYLHQQALDTSTPSGRAMFQMCGVFAEFERGMIRERVNAGLARAKAKGTKLGRRPVKPAIEARIRALKAEGMGILKIGRTVGVGTSVVQRVVGAIR
jgi:DNA invertase Pin-like site-specific DNA recombinase